MKLPKKSTLKAKLDRIVGAKCREEGVCARCGSQETIQWTHVSSRRYLITRWNPINYLPQCAACHYYQADHPTIWGQWFDEKFPGRTKEIYRLINSGESVDVHWMIRLYESLQ